jgi:PAS domain S-box-containing protein
MNEGTKTKEQLIEELAIARQLNTELKNSAAERKRIEDAIKGSEERYRKLVENAHDVLWVFDLNLGYTYVSPSVKRLRGYSVEEALKQRLDQVLTPESAKKARDLFERERLQEITGHRHGPDWSFTSEFEMIHKDGSTFWVEITMNPLHDEAGRIKGIMGVTRDISERKRAEEILNGSEKRYRLLAENARDVIWVLDENMKYKYVSPSVEKLRGYTPEEVMSQTMDQVLTPDSYKTAMDIFINELELEKSGSRHLPDWSMTLELELICKDGTAVWTEVNISLIYDEAGNPTGILGLTRDISDRKKAEDELKKHHDDLEGLVKKRTSELMRANELLKKEIQERKQAEEALRESTEKYRIHFSLANDVMFSYDNHLRILNVSPNVERVLGYKPQELVGGTFNDLGVLHPDYLEEATDNALNVLSGKTVYSSIYEFITKDGKRKFGEVSGVPMMHNGKAAVVITVARDITRRIEMANAIQESEERYRITLQSMPDAVSIMRIEDFRYLYVNDAFCEITGYSLEEAKRKTLFELNIPVTPEDLDHYIKNNESINNLEHQYRKKDGTVIDTRISARPVHYGGEDCLVMVMSDITSLKQIEEEKKTLEIQSQKMESIGTLASGIAHDFNNILTSIIGYTQMSMKDILSLTKGEKDLSVVRSDLNEVRKAAHRARDLVTHILAFSRHAEKDHVPVDLSSTIKGSLKGLRPTLSSNIKIREDLINQSMILGDPAQIHQVVTNLCTNAAHAMDKTGGELEVSLQRVLIGDAAALNLDVTPGPYLRMSVKDTGHGMNSKIIARIFDPYFTTKWRGHGTGLGLSIVHGIVKSHGGAISCKSAPGKGTTFDIYLPEYEFSKEEVKTIVEISEPSEPIGDRRILDLDEDLSHNEVNKKNNNPAIHKKNKEY